MERRARKTTRGGGMAWSQALLLLIIGLPALLAAAPTTMTSGEWITCFSFRTVQADIDGRNETVALPKMEFAGNVDLEELNEKIREGIKRQKAVFHLYHDGLGSPKRVGTMFFASDVYLKDLKMTYSGFLRQIGYNVTLTPTPPYEDSSYLREVQADRYLAMDRQNKPPKKPATPEKKPHEKKPATAPGTPAAGSSNIRTTWDVMPAGILPPEVRKMQAEIDARIRAVKNQPYKKEIIRVDAVRWASGVMGTIDSKGFIRDARLEGQRPTLWVFPPKEPDWLTPDRAKRLQGQPCEFIIQRDQQGLERRYQKSLHLADIYLTDLGLAWQDWIQEEGLTFVPEAPQVDWATGPIVMGTKTCHGSSLHLSARSLIKVRLDNALDKPADLVIRIQPPPVRYASFPAFAAKVHTLIKDQPLTLTLMLCPDGKPYRELGQYRAVRVYFPKLEATLNMLLERCQDPAPKRR